MLEKNWPNFSRFLLFQRPFVSLSPSFIYQARELTKSFVVLSQESEEQRCRDLQFLCEQVRKDGFSLHCAELSGEFNLLFDRFCSSVSNARNWNEKSWLVRQWKYLPLQTPCQLTVTNHSSGPSLRPCETHRAMVTPCSWGQRAVGSDCNSIWTYPRLINPQIRETGFR